MPGCGIVKPAWRTAWHPLPSASALPANPSLPTLDPGSKIVSSLPMATSPDTVSTKPNPDGWGPDLRSFQIASEPSARAPRAILPHGGPWYNVASAATLTLFLATPCQVAVPWAAGFHPWYPRANPMRHNGGGTSWAAVPAISALASRHRGPGRSVNSYSKVILTGRRFGGYNLARGMPYGVALLKLWCLLWRARLLSLFHRFSGGDWKDHAEGSPEASPFWGLRPVVGLRRPLW